MAARDNFLKNGYSRAGMAEIARDADVSTATLYKHFASKEALFSAVVRNVARSTGDYSGVIEPGDTARVIMIGSIGALWGTSSNGAYAYGASKAAIHQLTRMLASDLTAGGINVNAIAPGFFPSDMTDGFFAAVPNLKEQVVSGIPAGRLGSAEDIGGAALYLSSRAGAYVSGAVLPVEGALWQA